MNSFERAQLETKQALDEFAAHVAGIVRAGVDPDPTEAWTLFVYAAHATRVGLEVPAVIEDRIRAYPALYVEQVAKTHRGIIAWFAQDGPRTLFVDAVDLARHSIDHAKRNGAHGRAKDAWDDLEAYVAEVRKTIDAGAS